MAIRASGAAVVSIDSGSAIRVYPRCIGHRRHTPAVIAAVLVSSAHVDGAVADGVSTAEVALGVSAPIDNQASAAFAAGFRGASYIGGAFAGVLDVGLTSGGVDESTGVTDAALTRLRLQAAVRYFVGGERLALYGGGGGGVEVRFSRFIQEADPLSVTHAAFVLTPAIGAVVPRRRVILGLELAAPIALHREPIVPASAGAGGTTVDLEIRAVVGFPL